MAHTVINGRKFWMGELDFSNVSTSVSIDYGLDAQDDTTLADGTHTVHPGGLKTFGFAAEGFWDEDADNVIYADIGGAAIPLTVAPTDGTVGEVAYMINLSQGTYTFGGGVGEMFPFTVAGRAAGNLMRGQMAYNSTATESGNGSELTFDTLSSGEYMFSALHVLAVSGTAPTLQVVIESDTTGFPTPADRITHSEFSAIGSELLSVAGPISDTAWRVTFTIGGTAPSFTFVVALGIGGSPAPL